MLKEMEVAIEAAGRDQGKVFKVTEMPAARAEKWAARALLAMAKADVDIPEDAAADGIAGLARVGLKAFSAIPWEVAEPLMDEMFKCVSTQFGNTTLYQYRPVIDSDIEELGTRVKLRMAWGELQFGFSLAGKPSTSGSSQVAVEPGLVTPMSQTSLESS